MLKIRVVKTASSARAVQAVSYQNNKRIIIKHFGSFYTDEEVKAMLHSAKEWIKDFSHQLTIFPDDNPNAILFTNQATFIGVYYTFLYDLLILIQSQIGFTSLNHPMLIDLVIIRIFEPASKLRSIELLEQYFGINHLRKNYYKIAPQWLKLKENVESLVLEFAKKEYNFNFDLLFYDVTTLYFETFEEDELRKNGFSKDNKSQQPQVLVALMVTKEGFPIAYEVFAGNTFEGNTIIPMVKELIKKHNIKKFTVVADAAMISANNVRKLVENNINYIVGARLGNLSNELTEQIDKNIIREDGKSIRIKTDNGYLICNFSSLRYRKDKYEMEKQIAKAKAIIESPSKHKKVKFTKTSGEHIEINQTSIEKSKKLLGIKGYYTNLEENIVSNQTIIERYHELYRIEQAFRISKNDLQTRPIFHFKEEPIKLHILICFMALIVSKNIELTTGDSIRKFLTECKKVTDARILNHLTGKEIKMRARTSSIIEDYLIKFNAPH